MPPWSTVELTSPDKSWLDSSSEILEISVVGRIDSVSKVVLVVAGDAELEGLEASVEIGPEVDCI